LQFRPPLNTGAPPENGKALSWLRPQIKRLPMAQGSVGSVKEKGGCSRQCFGEPFISTVANLVFRQHVLGNQKWSSPKNPKIKNPKIENPKIKKSKTPKSKTQKSKTQKSKTQKPKNQKPKNQKPKNQKPKIKNSKIKDPKIKNSKIKKLSWLFNCHVFAAQFTVYDCSTSSIGKQDNY
jgi:hypothetical protein